MSLTSDTYEYIREINTLETKALSGEIDKLFINRFPFKIIAKWKPFKKFMKNNQFRPFAKRTFEDGVRRDIFDVMQPINILNKRNGGTDDSKKAYELIKQKWDSLPNKNPKKSNKWNYLSVSIAAVTLIVMISSGSQDWILPLLALGAILSLPTIVSLGVVDIFTRLFERWWYKHCKRQLDVDSLKSKIQDKTLGS